MPAIVAEALRKNFGQVRALDGLDLRVEQGTVVGLLGPNGAGKTTSVRVLTTLMQPDSGHVSIGGIDALARPHEVRKIIGVSGQYAALDDYLTGRENLIMFAELSQLPRNKARARADELIEQFDLAHAADRPVKGYSGGMRRRLDLASATLARPHVLFLDEPTTGLDPRSRIDLWAAIADLVALGTTVLLTTQYLEEADRLAERIAVVDHGRVIAEGTANELKARVGGAHLNATLVRHDQFETAVALLREVAHAEPRVDRRTSSVTVAIGDIDRYTAAVARFHDERIELVDIALARPNLDDVFLALTGHRSESTEQ